MGILSRPVNHRVMGLGSEVLERVVITFTVTKGCPYVPTPISNGRCCEGSLSIYPTQIGDH